MTQQKPSTTSRQAKPNQPPVAVSARRSPAAPTSPAGTFLSGKSGARRGGARRRPLRAIPAGEDEQARLDAVLHHRNALLEASRVLLRSLADMPALIRLGHDEALRNVLVQEVRTFERLGERANIRIEHIVGARYCLCTALDEAAMRELVAQKNTSGSVAWAADALTRRIREDNQGGSKIYALTVNLLNDADEHLALLEVIYRIFSLGFEGRYRQGAARGPHERIRERLYNEISSRAAPVPNALSPHAHSDMTAQPASYFEIPVRMSIAVLSVALLGLYIYCRSHLDALADEVHREFTHIVRVAPADSGASLAPRPVR